MIKPLKTDKPFHIFPIRLPVPLIAQIDEYAVRNSIKTRTAAIVHILSSALNLRDE